MNSENPPQGLSPGAYDESVALRQVLTQTLSKPITLGTFLLGAVGALGTILFVPGGALVSGIVLSAGLAVGTAGWYRNYFGKRGVYLQEYHAKLHEQFEAARKAKLRSLKNSLKADESQCVQGRRQVDDLDESFQVISDILTRKLSRGELMYSRFLGMAEQVYLSGLRNLEKIISLMMSVSSIDIAELDEEILKWQRVGRVKSLSGAQDRTLTALIKRKEVYEKAQSEIGVLLAQNDEAVTTLAQTSSAIAHLDTEAGSLSRSGIEDEMQSLIDFINRHGGGNTAETISLKLN